MADAFIKSSALNQSFGTQPVLRVSANDESLLRFDLSSLPSNAAIDSATLELYVNGDYGDGSIDVHRVLAPWTEANVTFGSFQQRFDSGNAAVFRVESRTALKNVDVTALARSWLNGAQPNYGMLLAEGADHHALRNNPQDEDKTPTLFVSSDASNASKRPALSVCYTVTTDDCSPNPCENGGTCSNTSTGHTCACAPGFTGNNCETKIDECAASPCLNGGTCVDAGGSYTCTCATGFTGASCETNIDDCAPNPCQNGGVCTDGIASYTCTCAPGFDGPNCANQIDNCASTPCHNGGTCSSVGAGYTCTCAGGFTGPTCDTNIDDCVNNACVNGTCVDGINSYTCSCAPDWGGTYCDVNLNTCAQHPCLNGGTCTNLPGNYTCSCAAGYTGTNCEIDINDCAPNPCENGGTCVDGVNSYACTCAAGYTGTQCETAVPPPVIAPISPVTMRAGATANALVTATDPSSSPITFSLGAGAPTWALLVPISTGTVEIALAPDSNVSGNFSIEIDATDGLGATAKAFLAVSVRADHPPVITVSDALGPVGTNINMRAGTAEQLAIAATSPDGWPVAVTVTTDPGGTTIDRLTNVWTWDTTSFDVGQTRTIHVEANDGVITVDEDVRVTVVPGLVQATTSAGDDPTPADPVYLEANGRAYVLVPEPAGLVVFDVTNDQIARVAVATTYGPAVGVAVISHWAFVAQGNAGVAIFDITNPNAPLHFGEIADPSDPVVGVTANPAMSQLVLSMGDGTLRFVDLSTFLLVPTHDLSWTSLSLPDALGFGVALGRPAIWGTHLFVPDGTNNVVDDVSLTTAGGPSVTGQMSFASCDFAASIQPFTTAANPHTFAIANCTDTAYVVDLTDFAAGISYTAAFLGSTSGESSAVVGTTMWTRTANFLTRSDVSNPFFPVQSDEVLVLADPTRGLAGNPAATRLYVSERGGGLAIIANDSASIVAEAPHVVPAGPTAIDGTLGVAVDGEQLFVFDTSAFPPVQVGVGTRAPGGFAQGMIAVALRGTLAITSEDIWGGSVGINRWIGVRLRTWDVSNPSAPHEISSVDVTNTSNLAIGTKAVHFIPQSNLVGVAGNMLGLVLFDVSNPAAPIVSKTVNMSINGAPLFDATVTDFASEGRYVFTVAANYPDTERVHVSAFDLGTPALAANATQVGLLRLPIGNEGWASLDAATHTLYVTEGPNGLAAVNVSNPAAMVQRSQLTFPFALLGASAFVGFPAAPLVMPGRVLESTAGYLVDVPRAADGSLGAAEYIPTAISGTLSTDTSCSLVTGTTCAAVTGGGGTQLWIP